MKKKQTEIDVLNECNAIMIDVIDRLEVNKIPLTEAKTILKDVKARKKQLIDSGTVSALHPMELPRLNAMIKGVALIIKLKEYEERKKLKG